MNYDENFMDWGSLFVCFRFKTNLFCEKSKILSAVMEVVYLPDEVCKDWCYVDQHCTQQKLFVDKTLEQ